jgi:ubiquinone/menaquinone biosynthesis C-methylase UbiE
MNWQTLRRMMPKIPSKKTEAEPDGMRRFHSLKEFDEFVLELNANGSEESRIPILSNSYLADDVVPNMPADPFSPEYRQAVLGIHARISGKPAYDENTMELTPVNIEALIAVPAPYQNGGDWLGMYFESYGHMIKKLEVKPGMRVIEYGCGEGEISLHLARMGCDVTVIDIEPNYIDVVKRKAEKLNLRINAICGNYSTNNDLGVFDRVFFYQSFHHSLEHHEFLDRLRTVVKPDGLIVFGGEPVVDPAGPWKHVVPYPWGPRLDGLSLRAMRLHGWMELGFQEPYFRELLSRTGWTCEKFQSETNGLVSSIVSRRTGR